MADFLPSKFLAPTRAQIAADWRRDYLLRNPGADVGPGSQPMLDSLTMADSTFALYAYAIQISGSTTWVTASGDGLRAWAQAMGTDLLPAVGAVGFVAIGAASGGTYIQKDDELTVNGIVYAAAQGGFFSDGAQVPVYGVTLGPQTDQDPGTVLKWSTPRPGLVPEATVVAQPDGSGLSGGANEETEAELKLRLSQLKSNPPGSGNDAMIQRIVTATPGVAIQQCFTYPAVSGPGTTGVTFTIRPSRAGGNRIPNAAQLSMALGYLQQNLPASDGILMCALAGLPLAIALKVVWAANAAGWSDPNPFPLYQSPGNNWVVDSAVVPTPTSFHISSMTDTTVPQPGQSIAVLDLASQTFARKRILSAASTGGPPYGYTITVDPSNGLSDTQYAPQVGQVVGPWSDSLDSLLAPVLAFLDTLGPGEQFASFFDAGLRQRRSPASPGQWPSVIGNRMLGGPPNASQPPSPNATVTPTLLSTSSLADVELWEVNGANTLPYATPVGSPGVSSNLLVLGSLVAYPE